MVKQVIYNNRTEMIETLSSGLIIAEIGVFEGQFSRLLYNTKPSRLYLVDLFGGRMGSGDENGENFKFVDLSIVYDSLKVEYPSEVVSVVRSTSVDFLESKPDGYFDVIYIDADHSYEAVKRDLELALLKTKIGGSIMGHDYCSSQFPGVYNAVNEFCKFNNLKIAQITSNKLPSYRIVVL